MKFEHIDFGHTPPQTEGQLVVERRDGKVFTRANIPPGASGEMLINPRSESSLDLPLHFNNRNDDLIDEVVIGEDDREIVKQPKVWPYSAIGRLVMRFPVGFASGSGVLVGPHHVLTCGHNMFVSRFGGWISSMKFHPAYSEDGGVRAANAARAITAVQWVANEDRRFDIGLVELDRSLGQQQGYFGMAALHSSLLGSSDVAVIGYPGDRDNGENMYQHSDRITAASDHRLIYQIDTFSGQSGSPVVPFESSASPEVVGIHTTGSSSGNGATRLTTQLLVALVALINHEGGLEEGLLPSFSDHKLENYIDRIAAQM